ncbi:MAG: shikimate dehydrogenase [Clostridia bacterium]|nr:shikimate dehydrogenase [Clostridia bacterium]
MQYGLIGKTLKHSFSAQIHPKLFNCKYELCELKSEELEQFFLKKDFCGINVTIPYKSEVIKYLDYLDETAKITGAVNTVINRNGKLYGYNTDYMGLEALIDKNGVHLKNKNILIFGNGATSNTASALCRKNNAKSITKLSLKPTENTDTYSNISKYYKDTDVIINTTPCGMFPNIFESAADLDGFLNLEAVFDVIYNPIRSKLICDAKNKGLKSEGGTYMLVMQALFSARLFSDSNIDKKYADDIFNEIMKEKENIVLIGMPSCGKTTIGKKLAELTDKTFFDVDYEIEKEYGISPKQIIEDKGEEFFRVAETKIIKRLSALQNSIIATGGGSVINNENVSLLKENGIFVFIDRDIKNLTFTSSRPLSSSYEKLLDLYKMRISLYKSSADFTVDGNKDICDIAKTIKGMFDL